MVVAFSVPPILFSGLAGVIADSYDRKKIFIRVNSLRLIAIIGAYFAINQPIGIIIVALTLSTIGEFFGPTHNSSIPSVVRHEHLYLANTVSTLTSYAGFLVGFSLAGPVLFYFGIDSIFLIALTLTFIALLAQFTLPRLDHHLKELNHQAINIFKNILFSIIFNVHSLLFYIIFK